jgi:hypothetical protein
MASERSAADIHGRDSALGADAVACLELQRRFDPEGS